VRRRIGFNRAKCRVLIGAFRRSAASSRRCTAKGRAVTSLTRGTLRADAPIVMSDAGVLAKRKLLRWRERMVAAAGATRSASSRARLDAPTARWAGAAETPAVLARLDASTAGLDEDEVKICS
jgi:hypothetical protein